MDTKKTDNIIFRNPNSDAETGKYLARWFAMAVLPVLLRRMPDVGWTDTAEGKVEE